MTCPYCRLDAPRRQLHGHLVDAHADVVATEVDEVAGRMFYMIRCPSCGGDIRHQVKPRWAHPEFLEEFGREIRLVAFDLLLFHVEDAHDGAGQ